MVTPGTPSARKRSRAASPSWATRAWRLASRAPPAWPGRCVGRRGARSAGSFGRLDILRLFSHLFSTMIGIPIGLALANASEWLMHKHVLHGLGRRRGSFWSFHWHEHHRASRKNEHIDDAYLGSALRWNAQGKETLALAAA